MKNIFITAVLTVSIASAIGQNTNAPGIRPLGGSALTAVGQNKYTAWSPESGPIEAATTNATPGTIVMLSPGTYTCSNAIPLPKDVSLWSAAGPYEVILNNYYIVSGGAQVSPLIQLGSNSIFGNISISNALQTVAYQACVGGHYNWGGKQYWNAVVANFFGWGDSDDYYLNASNACMISFFNSRIGSRWDAMAVQNTGGNGVPRHVTVLDHTRVDVRGPSIWNGAAAAHCYSENNGCLGDLFATNCEFYAKGGGGGSAILDAHNTGTKTFVNCKMEAGSFAADASTPPTMINCTFGQSIDTMFGDLNHYTFINTSLITRQIVDSGDSGGTGIEFRNTDFGSGKTWSSFIGPNSTFSGYVQATNSFIVRSNSMANLAATIAALLPGDAMMYSTNGVMWGIAKNPSGVLTTNKIFP